MSKVSMFAAGDQALRIVFENKINQTIHKQVSQLDDAISQKDIPGIRETIPAFRTLTVLYDALQTDYETLSETIRSLLSVSQKIPRMKKRIIEIPVCYDEQFGIDLKDVANHAGLSAEDVIQLHSERDYLIYMLGFLPGFAYLGGLNPVLSMPRLRTPRHKIQAGAVGIAGSQTGIYPVASPGGWRLIGSTPVQLFDADRESPFLYEAGDYIRFRPVSIKEYDMIRQQVYTNTYQCKVKIEEDGYGDPGNA